MRQAAVSRNQSLTEAETRSTGVAARVAPRGLGPHRRNRNGFVMSGHQDSRYRSASDADEWGSAMNRWTMALAVSLAMGLSGCFISETPLIGPEDAVFPYETISYKQPSDEKPEKLVRQGDSYVITAADSSATVEVRFKDLGDGLYLAQFSGEDNGKVSILYSVLKVDFDKKTAESYKAVGKDEFVREGLRKCGDGTLCIDDLDVYLELARSAIAAGEEPDVTYEIISTE
jgi:hypothetical protein